MSEQFTIRECISGRLGRVKREIDRIYRKHFDPIGLTESQVMLLLSLHEMKEIKQIELAKLLNLEKSSMSRNLVRLEDQQLIHKSESYHPVLSLSNQGRLMIDRVQRAWQEAMEESKKLIGDDGWNALDVLNNKL